MMMVVIMMMSNNLDTLFGEKSIDNNGFMDF